MKKFCIIALCVVVPLLSFSQDDRQKVERACLNYLEGFYEGDTVKLTKALKPTLFKTGFWKNKNTGDYEPDGNMTYRQALNYAKKVMEKKNFAKADAPKKVQVLDVENSIASAKVTAWWGVDYLLLSKSKGEWLIEAVLWEGPLQK